MYSHRRFDVYIYILEMSVAFVLEPLRRQQSKSKYGFQDINKTEECNLLVEDEDEFWNNLSQMQDSKNTSTNMKENLNEPGQDKPVGNAPTPKRFRRSSSTSSLISSNPKTAARSSPRFSKGARKISPLAENNLNVGK